MSRTSRALFRGSAVLILVIGCAAGAPLAAQASTGTTLSGPLSTLMEGVYEPPSGESTRVALPLALPQSLADVLPITEARGYPVQAYRFENPDIVGEYSPESGLSPSEFLAQFEDLYGTQPQFAAVIVEVPVATAKQWYQEKGAPDVAVRGAMFEAPLADAEHVDRLLEKYREKNPKRTATDSAAKAGMGDWQPAQATVDIVRPASGTVYSSQYYYWDGIGSNLSWTPSNYGLEMEINIRADSSTYQGGTRPLCPGGYKEQPFAQNYGWPFWAAYQNVGGGMTGVSSSVGAYADCNDLSDPCQTNSIAIGIKRPDFVNHYPTGEQEMLFTILAPRGVENTGRIGALVQSVNSSQCDLFPWMALTDCKGVVGGSVGTRPVLAEWRNWRAPEKCWFSDNYGTDPNSPPVTYPC